ncbi:hypothetical protein CRE_20453 [Caenorhabditis remanei]|uniref:Uncharacterized protein n=1 Tax=Caenorhabditis remanei TaxID=31234 RepID=E3N2T0_CAERE|nr:hypothetical protein CRE_20453 [Caenorhabditis remanei]
MRPANKRKSLTKEELRRRLIESRQTYSTRPPPSARPEPRVSMAPLLGAARPKPPDVPRRIQKTSSFQKKVEEFDDEFRVDQSSMAMIESGNVVIPARNQTNYLSSAGRPSLFGTARPRNTIGGGRAQIMQPTKFRASIAVNEPRESLFPLGINIFSASESQRSEVEGFLKERIEAATPAKKGGGATMDPMKSQRVRFKEETPTKGAESDEKKENVSDDVSAGNATSSSSILMSPTTIRAARKKAHGFATTPIPANPRRRIDFDVDLTMDESKTVTSIDKENDEKCIQKKIATLQKIIQELATTTSSLSPTDWKSLESIQEQLGSLLASRKAVEVPKKPALGPICEDEDEEETEQILEQKMEKLVFKEPALPLHSSTVHNLQTN